MATSADMNKISIVMGETLRSHFTPNQMITRQVKQKTETLKSLDLS
jgi:hypothetical protein